jgi:hypothetical protein
MTSYIILMIPSDGARQEVDRICKGADGQIRGTSGIRAEQPLEGMHTLWSLLGMG